MTHPTNVTHWIARRYLFSRKHKSVINIISWISLVGIAVSTMAMVVVLSVYNGIGDLTQGLYNVFDPELKIEPVVGKSISTNDIDCQSLLSIPEVAAVCPVVEENAWITYRNNEAIVTLRGVDTAYQRAIPMEKYIYEGQYILHDTAQFLDPESGTPNTISINYLLLGYDIYLSLGASVHSQNALAVRIPKRSKSIGLSVDEAFNTGYALTAGNFGVQHDADNRYVLTNIAFARQLLDYTPDQCTFLSVTAQPGKETIAQKKVATLLGKNYQVRNRMQQQPLYYKIFRSERLAVYLVLSLIVLICTLNLVAALSLLIIDKRKDTNTLLSLGMTEQDLRRIFFTEGVLISAVGVIVGAVIGLIVCLLQQQFGIVKMGDGYVTPAFPVSIRGIDILLTVLLVMGICAGAVWIATFRKRFTLTRN